MSQAGSSRRATDRALQRRAADEIERPDIATTVRKFAVECINPAHAAWEQATDGRNGEWKQLTFFWLRELKRHPTMNGKPPDDVANAVARLFETEPDIRGLFEGDGFGKNDIQTFVQARWARIKCAGGENPLLAAARNARAKEITWKLLDSHLDEVARLLPTRTPASLIGRQCKAWFHELDSNPMWGLFLATIWNLRQSLFDPQEPTEPVLILPCVTLGKALGVNQSTAWDHRIRASNMKLIEKLPLPKQSKQDADRFRLASRFPVVLSYFKERFLSTPRDSQNAIELD